MPTPPPHATARYENVADFDYHLPESLIATRPVEPRDAARLLVMNPDGTLDDRQVRDLPTLLQAGDLLVFNDTKVIPARLFGRRGEMSAEVLLHRQLDSSAWEVYARPAKRLKDGQTIDFQSGLSAEVIGRNEIDGTLQLRFSLSGTELMSWLQANGHMPLPPYMNRAADAADNQSYQTMFADREGAVAAPTASLHYTPQLTDALTSAGIQHTKITLHVGAGTFMPMRVDRIADHVMHEELFEVSAATAEIINQAKAEGRRIIPVGTTALRALESAADDNGKLQAMSGATRLFITPGYRFKIADALLTNFHLPKSTLLMLVAAFAGKDRAEAAYAHAISRGYRFYSYGDTSLIYPAA